MLLYQTDYLTIDLETNETWLEMPLNVTIQCNGRLRRTTQHVGAEKVDNKYGSSTMVNREWDNENYDLDKYSHVLLDMLIQTFRDLWYDLPLECRELSKLIVANYLKNKPLSQYNR